MTEGATVEYVANPQQSERWEHGQHVFGAYKVRFEDGFTVMIPHVGWPNTISADPLDVEDDEHRAVIVEHADRVRLEHHTKADLDVLPTTEKPDGS